MHQQLNTEFKYAVLKKEAHYQEFGHGDVDVNSYVTLVEEDDGR